MNCYIVLAVGHDDSQVIAVFDGSRAGYYHALRVAAQIALDPTRLTVRSARDVRVVRYDADTQRAEVVELCTVP